MPGTEILSSAKFAFQPVHIDNAINLSEFASKKEIESLKTEIESLRNENKILRRKLKHAQSLHRRGS